MPIHGNQIATGIVRLAALITNSTRVCVTVFLLQSAVAKSAATKPGASPSITASVGNAAVNLLVWSPILGAIVALLGIRSRLAYRLR